MSLDFGGFTRSGLLEHHNMRSAETCGGQRTERAQSGRPRGGIRQRPPTCLTGPKGGVTGPEIQLFVGSRSN